MRRRILFLFSLTLTSWLNGQVIYEAQEITAGDALPNARFGYTMAIEDSLAFIGAPGDSGNGDNAGAVYLFIHESMGWQQIDKLLNDNNQPNDFFGYSLAVSGDYLFVGTPIIDAYQGAVFVFHRTENGWEQIQKLTDPEGEEMDFFGYSVDVQGDMAVVGAYGDDEGGEDAGAILFFRNVGGSWTLLDKLITPDAGDDHHFGISVSIYGVYAVAGAPLAYLESVQTGAAYVFEYFGEVWTEASKIVSSDAALGDHFGEAVSIYGDELVVGADYKSGNSNWEGAAYVFGNTGFSWTETQKLFVEGQEVASKHFGNSVKIFGDNIIVGASGSISFQPYTAGSAYIFSKIADTWQARGELLSTDNEDDDLLGFAVSISDQYTLVSAQTSDIAGEDAGAVYAFDVFQPEIVTQPEAVSAISGGDAGFSVTAIGSELSYQWKKDGQNIVDDAHISGSQTDSLILTNISVADTGVYSCVVANGFGSVESEGANLSIGTATHGQSIEKLSVFPNPVPGLCKLVSTTLPRQISIRNANGQLIRRIVPQSKSFFLDLSGLEKGVYFIEMGTDDDVFVKKIVKI